MTKVKIKKPARKTTRKWMNNRLRRLRCLKAPTVQQTARMRELEKAIALPDHR